MNFDLLIIGSGPAGYTASIYAARAMLKTGLIKGTDPGGQLAITTEVENYPGFENPIQGPLLMQRIEKQSKKNGVEVIEDHATEFNKKNNLFICKGEINQTYLAQSVIIATGSQAKWLGLTTEKKFMGFGVSACATCDGFFFKNKSVCVIGGGNTAAEEALYLSNICSKVYLIHRRNKLSSEKILQKRIFDNKKIEIIWDHILQEVNGSEYPLKVTNITIKNKLNNQLRILEVNGVFIAIGHKPNTELFKNKIRLDSENYIVTKPNSTATSLTGVFAAGDVQDKIFRQAITAAGSGCMAAMQAERYLRA